MNKTLKLVIIGLISLIGVYLAFRGEDLTLILVELKKVDLKGVLLASLILLFSCLIRAMRWKILIEPFSDIKTKQVFSATMIGYFGNGVLVFRLGELLKSYIISKNAEINTSQAFGTVILERFIDLVMVFIFCIALLPWIPVQYNQVKLFIYILFGIIMCLIFVQKRYKLIKFLNVKFFFRNTKQNKVLNYINNIYDGLISIKDIQSFKAIMFYSFILWFIYLFVTLILLNSCDIELSFINAVVLFVFGSIAIGIPSLPGSLGTYDAAVKYVLIIIFGIKSYQALNYVIVSHAVSYFPLTIVGAVFFIFENVNLKNLKNIG